MRLWGNLLPRRFPHTPSKNVRAEREQERLTVYKRNLAAVLKHNALGGGCVRGTLFEKRVPHLLKTSLEKGIR
jgi:hypothetical protein